MAAPPLTLSGKFEERIVDRQGRDIRRSCDTAGRVCDGSKRVRRHSSPATDLDTGQRFTAKQAPHRALRYSETQITPFHAGRLRARVKDEPEGRIPQ